MSIMGERAEALAELTCDRRAARCAEIVAWHEAIAAGAWVGKGYRSPSAWMAAATGEPVGACKRVLTLGERLEQMPHVADLFRVGLVSEAAVGLVADVWSEQVADAFERDELLFADWISRRPFREAKIKIEAWVAIERRNAAEEQAECNVESRHFSVIKLGTGMSTITGALDNEGTAAVRAALSLLGQVGDDDTRSPGQRHADALVTMARFALSHFEHPVGLKKRPPKVSVTIPYETLLTRNGIGLSDDHVIMPDSARRLACDAGLHRVITHAGSAVVDYGRQTRTISEPLWRLLVERDGGCRFPGCEVPGEMCDAHHAVHWADGGSTEPESTGWLGGVGVPVAVVGPVWTCPADGRGACEVKVSCSVVLSALGGVLRCAGPRGGGLSGGTGEGAHGAEQAGEGVGPWPLGGHS